MKNIICIVLISWLLCGCFGGITKNNKPVTKVNRENLIGKWKADKFSYEYTINFIENTKEKVKDSISLILKKDGTFVLQNGIKKTEKDIEQKDYHGTWELAKRSFQNQDQYEIRLHSKKDFGSMPSRLPIYLDNKTYRLFVFIDDPDMGERICFEKTIAPK